MTTPEALRALAERVEREEPSLLLDYDIHHGIAKRGAGSIPSSYTTSLDAAVTLVPEECGVDLSRYWLMEGERWSATLAWGIKGDHVVVLDVTTPAAALTAAALRARAADMQARAPEQKGSEQ